MRTVNSNMPIAVYIGLIAVVIIWLTIDIVIAIKKKNSIGIPIGLFFVIISGVLFILYSIDMLTPDLSKQVLFGGLATCFLGVGITICGGIRDFKRAGRKTSPGMKKIFIGWGILMSACVITLIIAFIGKKLTGT